MKTSRGRVGVSQSEVQSLKVQQTKFQETARGAYEYGMGLLMAALVLRRSAGLSPDRNRTLAAQLGSVWNRLLAAIREQMTRLRVAGLFYRDIAQHETDLKDLIETGSSATDAEQVFRTLGRTVRLGRLLQRKICEPLLPGEGFDTCPENGQAVAVMSDWISSVTELAHRLDLGNSVRSRLESPTSGLITDYSSAGAFLNAEDSVFDMEEIDVQVAGFDHPSESFEDEEEDGQDILMTSAGRNSNPSCYQSASSDCSFSPSSSGMSPPSSASKLLEQLDMKPMQDFRDYVNFTPSSMTNSAAGSRKLFVHAHSSSTGSSSAESSGGGLSPGNSSEDSGFVRLTRPVSSGIAAKQKLLINKSATAAEDSSSAGLTTAAPRFRSSICYARSASCDSLF